MANVTLKGNPIHTFGEPPKVGNPGPDFRLTRGDLSDLSLTGFEGTGGDPQHRARLDTAWERRPRAGSRRKRATAATWSC